MTEFLLRAIISAFIFILIWFSIGVMYFKYKLNTLKNRRHVESNFHSEVYKLIGEVTDRLERKVGEIEVKISELEGKK
ncbi:MAG: hypothetical protein K9I82_01905 [Chitinophagaceae bacterium]|nr:hypothetical protein [Chitinophagaceae bacterium]